jgi:hypothetical protein
MRNAQKTITWAAISSAEFRWLEYEKWTVRDWSISDELNNHL